MANVRLKPTQQRPRAGCVASAAPSLVKDALGDVLPRLVPQFAVRLHRLREDQLTLAPRRVQVRQSLGRFGAQPLSQILLSLYCGLVAAHAHDALSDVLFAAFDLLPLHLLALFLLRFLPRLFFCGHFGQFLPRELCHLRLPLLALHLERFGALCVDLTADSHHVFKLRLFNDGAVARERARRVAARSLQARAPGRATCEDRHAVQTRFARQSRRTTQLLRRTETKSEAALLEYISNKFMSKG
eukprot:scaffold719_cov226-Pinguiococcus_pyrenoidosus.AAC.2